MGSSSYRVFYERIIMTKYLLGRIIRGIFSVVIVVIIVMLLVYSFMDRELIFRTDPVFSKKKSNAVTIYKMQRWEDYGYLDYISYEDYVFELKQSGEIDEDTRTAIITIGSKKDGSSDSAIVKEYVNKFKAKYEAMGYIVDRLPGDTKPGSSKYKDGGQPHLYAHKDIPVFTRLWEYFSGLITIDNIHYAQGIEDSERGLSFTFFDPVYGGEKFSPAIMGNGTKHKYLLYCTDTFPFIQQNLISVSLGKSYTVNKGIDVFNTMNDPQGALSYGITHYPSGLVIEAADNLHSATYVQGSSDSEFYKQYFTDDYTSTITNKTGFSRMGYSFVIGIISVILSYLLGIPLGTVMALKKDKWFDKLGTLYIIFIIAVPSLGYIFLFKSIGQKLFGLPGTFDLQLDTWKIYVLPIISLALPSVAGFMKWIRRYMIDQMNSDYVKFARSGGLSEGEIFSKHILKNAIIPIVHGIPGSFLGALVGAIITESVYVVPGTGNLLTKAINAYDNGVIVGVTLFYAILSVISIILGDILMSLVDPRISFSSKNER